MSAGGGLALPQLVNGSVLPLEDLPRLTLEEFSATLRTTLSTGARVAALFGVPEERLPEPRRHDALRLIAILADDAQHTLQCVSASVGTSFPSLTPDFPQLHRFEREIYEQWGVEPLDHPWLKPVRFQKAYRAPAGRVVEAPIVGEVEYFRVGGQEIHEVAVGPVHAGIIEPGHFRFQCLGEHVYHLEISLGYQHRGVERGLRGGPDRRSLHYVETLAGDTTIGHALAYAQALEGLGGVVPPPRARALRAVALELERLANHTGDLGALAGDVAFLPTASYCGRIRGDFLNLTALLCGNRFGRGFVVPGGNAFAVDEGRAAELAERLASAGADVTSAVELLWRTSSVLARFEGTGALTRELAHDMGLVGVAARATGLTRDVRADFPFDHDPLASIPVATAEGGDVMGRAQVRWREMLASLTFLREQLAALPEGAHWVTSETLRPNRLVVSLVEGWRGEICHVALTDEDGRFAHYKVVDPSFHNWAGLALALRDQQISDFPLCNKSFNLSYCGQDLCDMPLFDVLLARLRQGFHTGDFPPRETRLSDRFRGRPIVDPQRCRAGCSACAAVCPTDAIHIGAAFAIDLGRCLFCTDCVNACPTGAVSFSQDYRLATRHRPDLLADERGIALARALDRQARRLFGRSLKLRQVSAGGCNACEADTNVLSTLVFDLGRYGIQFVASPRHADGLLVTGPVSRNMELALRKTYDAVPSPKLVIAVGACAISGGPYIGHEEVAGGADALLPVDLYVPGCPPHPLTILDGLLRLLGRVTD